MSDTWKGGKGRTVAPLSAPKNIVHEVEYRGRRICLTDDQNLVGQKYPDKWGFTVDKGFVVLDEFDDHVFPAGWHWFYTADDAAAAIELLDLALDDIKAGTPHTTFNYEYGLMRRYRAEFGVLYATLVKMQRIIDEAKQLDDNPTSDIAQALHDLRQNVARGTGKEIGA